MVSTRGMVLRLVLYGAVLLYLAADFLLDGPLSRALRQGRQVVAAVAGTEITKDQLDQRIRECLWLAGHEKKPLPPAEFQAAHDAALNDLVDEILIDHEVAATNPAIPVSPQEIDERIRMLAGRFDNRTEMAAAVAGAGLRDEAALRSATATRIRREKWVESEIAPTVVVTQREARDWYEANRETQRIPERVAVRHVFLPTLDRPPEEVKAKMEAALAELVSGRKNFATLARETSEDPATKGKGGELGWITRGRVIADFTAAVFELQENNPTLIRSRIGWHLVEVTDRKPSEDRSFEDVRAETMSALEAIKRRDALRALRHGLRKDAMDKIRIFR
ncbi:MAG: peptidylprolyl isomerase [Verrucomicrobiota bacterium]